MLNRQFPVRAAAAVVRRLVRPLAWTQRLLEARLSAEKKKNAEEAELRRLEALYGPLSPDARARIEAYAQEVLGSRRYWLELAAWTLVAGEFREGWTPNTYRGAHVDAMASGTLGTLSQLKSMTRRLLQGAPLPDIGFYANGVFLDREFSVIPESQLPDALFAKSDRIVFKADGSLSGMAVWVFDRASFDDVAVRKTGSGVFQRFVHQHDALAAVSPGPVGTLRVVTWHDGETVSLRGCYLRMGRAQQSHIVPEVGLRCAIDVAGECLTGRGVEYDLTPHDRHPDTGTVLDGHKVPGVASVVEVAQRLHGDFPAVRLIGWDFTIEEGGEATLLEWNFRPALKFDEPLVGPCFADLGWETYWRE